MTLPFTNISFNLVNTELGRVSTDTIDFNDASVRALANKRTGRIGFDNLLNKTIGGSVWDVLPDLSPRGFAFNGTTYVVVGESGVIYTSTNSTTWVRRDSGIRAFLQSIVWADTLGMFVAVGNNGQILTSTDGLDWIVRRSNSTATLNRVVWLNGNLIVGGGSGVIRTSTDGVTWTSRTSGTSSGLFTAAWSGTNSLYVMVGAAGTIITSPDLVTWTSRTSGTASNYRDVIRVGGKFIAAGSAGTISTSTDGITWTSYTQGTAAYYSIAYSGTNYLLVGSSGTVLTSTTANSGTWSAPSPAPSPSITDIVFWAEWINSRFIVCVDNGKIYTTTSSTGASLTERINSPSNQFNSFAYLNNNYVIVGELGAIYTSTDAYSWTSRSSGVTATLNDVAFGASTYVAVGNSGAVRTSTNLTTWTGVTVGTQNINGIVFANSVFVHVAAGKIRSSTNGTTWTDRLTIGNIFYGVAFGGNKFIAVGELGAIYDGGSAGTTWTARTSGTTSNLNHVTHDGTQFIAVGAGGVVVTSTDGITWAAATSPAAVNLLGNAYSPEFGVYVAVGAGGVIYSTTAITGLTTTWTTRTSGITTNINCVNWTGIQFGAVGDSGKILLS